MPFNLFHSHYLVQKVSVGAGKYVTDLALAGGQLACVIQDADVQSSKSEIQVFPFPEITAKQREPLCKLTGHTRGISSIAYFPKRSSALVAQDSSPNLVSASWDKTGRFWDTRTGKQTNIISFRDEQYSVAVSCDDVLVAFGGPQTVQVFDVRNTNTTWMKIEDSHSDDVSAIMFHPTKPKMLFTGGLDMLVNNFNLEYENEDDALEHGLTFNTEGPVYKMGFYCSNKKLWCLSQDYRISLFDLKTQNMLRKFDDGRKQLLNRVRPLPGDVQTADYLIGCTETDNGKLLTVFGGTEDGKIRASTLPTGHTCSLRNAHTATVRTVVPANKMLVTGGEDGVIAFWGSKKHSLKM